MKQITMADVLFVLAIFIVLSGWEALRWEDDTRTGCKKMAWRWEEVNWWSKAAYSLVPLARKVDWKRLT